jgi:hypothetical protein
VSRKYDLDRELVGLGGFGCGSRGLLACDVCRVVVVLGDGIDKGGFGVRFGHLYWSNVWVEGEVTREEGC